MSDENNSVLEEQDHIILANAIEQKFSELYHVLNEKFAAIERKISELE